MIVSQPSCEYVFLDTASSVHRLFQCDNWAQSGTPFPIDLQEDGEHNTAVMEREAGSMGISLLEPY